MFNMLNFEFMKQYGARAPPPAMPPMHHFRPVNALVPERQGARWRRTRGRSRARNPLTPSGGAADNRGEFVDPESGSYCESYDTQGGRDEIQRQGSEISMGNDGEGLRARDRFPSSPAGALSAGPGGREGGGAGGRPGLRPGP